MTMTVKQKFVMKKMNDGWVLCRLRGMTNSVWLQQYGKRIPVHFNTFMSLRKTNLIIIAEVFDTGVELWKMNKTETRRLGGSRMSEPGK